MKGQWGSSRNLASRMRENIPQTEVKTPEAKAKEVKIIKAINSDNIAKEHWYIPMGEDGALRDPVPVALGSACSVMVALVALNDKQEVLLVKEHNDSLYLPVTELCSKESFSTCLDRLFIETGLSSTDAEDIRVVSMENYPSLHENWFRVSIAVQFHSSTVNDTASWITKAAVVAKEVKLMQNDISGILEAVDRSIRVPVPVCSPSLGFSYLLVEVALFYDGKLSLVKTDNGSWTFPITHIDRGENITFAGSRLIRGLLQATVPMAGIINITHSSQIEGMDGMRITLVAVSEKKIEIQESNKFSHILVDQSELREMKNVRTDLGTLLANSDMFDSSVNALKEERPGLTEEEVMKGERPPPIVQGGIPIVEVRSF